MRKPVIAGNWKMNGTLPEAENLVKSILAGQSSFGDCEVVVCPSFPVIGRVSQLLEGSKVCLGAQDMSQHESGAYTSEVSALILLTVGVSHVILGHSERRQYHAETDELINAKTRHALGNKLTPIVCVGESLDQREKGETESVIGKQVDRTLSGLKTEDLKRTIIAYEPVWAIGTGKTATPEMAQDVHRFIRERIKKSSGQVADDIRILYGGSVKPDNAEELLASPDIDGALVGGASLKADDFLAIIKAL